MEVEFSISPWLFIVKQFQIKFLKKIDHVKYMENSQDIVAIHKNGKVHLIPTSSKVARVRSLW